MCWKELPSPECTKTPIAWGAGENESAAGGDELQVEALPRGPRVARPIGKSWNVLDLFIFEGALRGGNTWRNGIELGTVFLSRIWSTARFEDVRPVLSPKVDAGQWTSSMHLGPTSLAVHREIVIIGWLSIGVFLFCRRSLLQSRATWMQWHQTQLSPVWCMTQTRVGRIGPA